MMTDDNVRVLIVDDSVIYRRIITEVLADMPGIKVISTAPNGKIALAKIERLRPDVFTLDLEMPEMDGLEVLRRLRQANIDIGVIVLSGSSKHEAKATMAALGLGAFDFVEKPVGGTPEENTQKLRKGLQPRIEAFVRARHNHKILRGQGSPPPIITAQPPSTYEHNAARRMRRIVSGAAAWPEVVAVGISTGGPRTLNRMLPQLPVDFGAAVLVVQHMPAVFTKSLADELNKRCALPVSEAVHGQPVMPGHILIAPGDKQMKVTRASGRGTVCITDDPAEKGYRPSVNYLFRSVARAYGPNAIGVIMTGMGNDGAQGCRQMKQRGAVIIAQDEASSVVFGMPREPIEEGIADVVAPPDEIVAKIVRLVEQGMTACR